MLVLFTLLITFFYKFLLLEQPPMVKGLSLSAPQNFGTLFLNLQNSLKLWPSLKRNLKHFFFLNILNLRLISLSETVYLT